jgi:phage shock protein A
MGMMTRFVRMWKADMHGVMDQLEDKGLTLKQSLRDMEEELERKKAGLQKMIASRDDFFRELDKKLHECDKLEQDLQIAVAKEKDDIARLLIKKIKPLKNHCDSIQHHIEELERDIDQYRRCVEEQRLQYEQFHLRADEYFHQAQRRQWENDVPSEFFHGGTAEPTAEEIELELLRRKEAIQAKGGNYNEHAS